MGDHGPIGEPFLQKLPLMSFVVSRALVLDRPDGADAMQALRTNQARLTSHFDVRKTVFDLAGMADPLGPGRASPGRSLLRALPRDRTCADAGIPRSHCCCTARWEAVADARRSERIARGALARINAAARRLKPSQ